MSNFEKPMFTGNCIGVDIVDRGQDDKHKCVVVCVEDDELWHRKISVSSFWLDEMIAKLQEAKTYLNANCKKGEWGYNG